MPRSAKKKQTTGKFEKESIVIQDEVEQRRGGFIPIIIPTGDARHLTGIRVGKISSEVFARKPERRKELGLPPILSYLD